MVLVWWKYYTMVSNSAPLPNSPFNDLMLVPWNWPWRENYTTEIGNPYTLGLLFSPVNRLVNINLHVTASDRLILPLTHKNTHTMVRWKRQKVPSISKNVEQLEISYIAGKSDVDENILGNYFVVFTNTIKMPTLCRSKPTPWCMSNKNANIYPSRYAQACHSSFIHNSQRLEKIHIVHQKKNE